MSQVLSTGKLKDGKIVHTIMGVTEIPDDENIVSITEVIESYSAGILKAIGEGSLGKPIPLECIDLHIVDVKVNFTCRNVLLTSEISFQTYS